MDITVRINELIQKGITFCLATVIASDRADIAAGQKIIVLDNGPMVGELGDRQLGLAVKALAREVITGKKPGLVEIKPGVQVFFDLICPELKLIVCGAGHIAIPCHSLPVMSDIE
jgi:hypothetical protein